MFDSVAIIFHAHGFGRGLREFVDKEHLNFTLLGDEDHSVADKYGVWVEKSMYGRTFWGVKRSTFIIGPDGVVKHVIPNVKPATHDDEVLAVLAELEHSPA